MGNKKAWLRIVEAFVAILLIASVLIVLAVRAPEQDRTESIHEIQRNILRQVSLNDSLRGEILQNQEENTKNFIGERMPVYLNFTMRICEVDEVCGMDFYLDKEIYGDEVLISSTLENYQPKKLKFFVWEK